MSEQRVSDEYSWVIEMWNPGRKQTKHQHEPEIPPCFDSEGRCLICVLLGQVEDARATIREQREEIERLTDKMVRFRQALNYVTGYPDPNDWPEEIVDGVTEAGEGER